MGLSNTKYDTVSEEQRTANLAAFDKETESFNKGVDGMHYVADKIGNVSASVATNVAKTTIPTGDPVVNTLASLAVGGTTKVAVNTGYNLAINHQVAIRNEERSFLEMGYTRCDAQRAARSMNEVQW